MLSKPVLFLFIVWLSMLPACGQNAESAYHVMLESLYSNTVPTITVGALQKKLQHEKLILLDTRTKEEYKVSHLKGARFTGFDEFNLKSIAGVAKDTPIVVYCSVGYRSEKIGEKLKRAGYTNVQNLYGGLFEWVNQGKPVYNREGKTNKVHGYSRAWGVWLREGEKVYD